MAAPVRTPPSVDAAKDLSVRRACALEGQALLSLNVLPALIVVVADSVLATDSVLEARAAVVVLPRTAT